MVLVGIKDWHLTLQAETYCKVRWVSISRFIMLLKNFHLLKTAILIADKEYQKLQNIFNDLKSINMPDLDYSSLMK